MQENLLATYYANCFVQFICKYMMHGILCGTTMVKALLGAR